MSYLSGHYATKWRTININGMDFREAYSMYVSDIKDYNYEIKYIAPENYKYTYNDIPKNIIYNKSYIIGSTGWHSEKYRTKYGDLHMCEIQTEKEIIIDAVCYFTKNNEKPKTTDKEIDDWIKVGKILNVIL